MSIRLNRKKLLCISFFLCCVLPACFSWFSVDDTQWSGLSLMEMPLLISTSMFAFALLFERIRYILPIGILSHILLTISIAVNFFNFPVIAGVSGEHSITTSLDTSCPMFWVSAALHLFHLAIFTTTEIAMQNLSKKTTASPEQSE